MPLEKKLLFWWSPGKQNATNTCQHKWNTLQSESRAEWCSDLEIWKIPTHQCCWQFAFPQNCLRSLSEWDLENVWSSCVWKYCVCSCPLTDTLWAARAPVFSGFLRWTMSVFVNGCKDTGEARAERGGERMWMQDFTRFINILGWQWKATFPSFSCFTNVDLWLSGGFSFTPASWCSWRAIKSGHKLFTHYLSVTVSCV